MPPGTPRPRRSRDFRMPPRRAAPRWCLVTRVPAHTWPAPLIASRSHKYTRRRSRLIRVVFYVSLAFQLRRHNPDRGQAFMLRVTAHMPFSSTPSLTSPCGANVTPLPGRSLRGGRDANGHADNSKSGVEALVPSGALASPVLRRFVRGWRVGADIPITLVGVNTVSAYIPPHRNSHRFTRTVDGPTVTETCLHMLTPESYVEHSAPVLTCPPTHFHQQSALWRQQ